MKLGVNAQAFHLLETALFDALRKSATFGVAGTRKHVFVYVKETSEPLVRIEYRGEEKSLSLAIRSSTKSEWGQLPVDVEAIQSGIVQFRLAGHSMSAEGMAEAIVKRVEH